MKKQVHIVVPIGLLVLLMIAPLWVAATELSGLRLGQTPDQTRVVFEINNNAGFEVIRLTNPDRIVVDFNRAKNGISFQQRNFRDPRIARIRVAENSERTRVVLDLRDRFQYRYFTLARNGDRPERLVIDLSPTLLAEAKPEPQPAQRTTEKRAPTVQLAQAAQPKAEVSAQARSQAPAASEPKHEPKKETKSAAVKTAQAPAAPAQRAAQRSPTPAERTTQDLLNNNRDFKPKKEFVVAIDPGHGGRDSGAVGPTGVMEKDVVLALSKRLKAEIDAMPGMRAVLTRDRDIYLGLSERVEIARRAQADLFISVHADAYKTQAPRGGSVFVLSNQGATSVMARRLAQSENQSLGVVKLAGVDQDLNFVLNDLTREANVRASRKLAGTVAMEMAQNMRMHRREPQAANFAVLRSIDMPSMLIEAAFISNPYEERQLTTAQFQNTFARSIAQGVARFIERSGHQPSWGETMYVQHEVRRGDTLSQLAQAYGLTTRELMRVNNIRNANQLYVGRKLRIPVTESLMVEREIKYTVRRGDTLSQIAARHNVPMRELMQKNNIRNANQLYVGRELSIPVRQQILAAIN